jgi:hypothetical protein
VAASEILFGEEILLDLVEGQASQELSTWSPRERGAFRRLWSKARSPLQKELLIRSLAAGHKSEEVAVFAEMIRNLRDSELYQACTLDETQAMYEPLRNRQWAEADPIYAFVLNGHPLVPAKRHEAERFEVKESRPTDELLMEVCQPMGIVYVQDGLSAAANALDEALLQAAGALLHGFPVPVLLGRDARQLPQYALFLQMQMGQGEPSFQFYDPVGGSLSWVKAGVFRAGKLPPPYHQEGWRIIGFALPRLAQQPNK